MSMMFWGLTVPETGRLDSLPYELMASLRHECPPLPIAPGRSRSLDSPMDALDAAYPLADRPDARRRVSR
jgi:hypothetical protein